MKKEIFRIGQSVSSSRRNSPACGADNHEEFMGLEGLSMTCPHAKNVNHHINACNVLRASRISEIPSH